VSSVSIVAARHEWARANDRLLGVWLNEIAALYLPIDQGCALNPMVPILGVPAIVMDRPPAGKSYTHQLVRLPVPPPVSRCMSRETVV
jgi:hypothetical protein